MSNFDKGSPMNTILRRSLLSLSIAAIASAGVLAGCDRKTTTSSDGTTTTTTTVTSPAPAMKSAANEMKNDAKVAANKAGTTIEDSTITAKVKTALWLTPTSRA